MMLKEFKPALILLLVFTVLTGAIYPALVTAIAQTAFRSEANGSLIVRDGHAVGSQLIGQSFTQDKYFWGRPSATTSTPYNAMASSGSNLGPTHPALEQAVRERMAALKAGDPTQSKLIPVDLVTSSASGLDPQISPAAALWQVPRVAKNRGMSEEKVEALVEKYTEGRQLNVLGEARVNVLTLNLALDGMK